MIVDREIDSIKIKCDLLECAIDADEERIDRLTEEVTRLVNRIYKNKSALESLTYEKVKK